MGIKKKVRWFLRWLLMIPLGLLAKSNFTMSGYSFTDILYVFLVMVVLIAAAYISRANKLSKFFQLGLGLLMIALGLYITRWINVQTIFNDIVKFQIDDFAISYFILCIDYELLLFNRKGRVYTWNEDYKW